MHPPSYHNYVVRWLVKLSVAELDYLCMVGTKGKKAMIVAACSVLCDARTMCWLERESCSPTRGNKPSLGSALWRRQVGPAAMAAVRAALEAAPAPVEHSEQRARALAPSSSHSDCAFHI